MSWDPQVVQALCRLRLRKGIDRRDIDEALTAGHPEVLQQRFDAYLAQSLEPGNHGLLTWVYDAAFGPSKVDLATIKRWLEADPDSAYALAARGSYYLHAAWKARGNKTVAETPPENFERMHKLAAKAQEDLSEAGRRNPRLIAAHVALIQVAQLTGDHGLRDASVERALAVDPADQRLYVAWLGAVAPKWGGSTEEVEKVIEQADLHSADNPLLKRMRTRAVCAEADFLADDAERLAVYRRAAASMPAACFVEDAGAAAERLGRYDTAALYYSQQYRFQGVGEGLFRRIGVLQRMGNTEGSLEALNAVVQEDPENAAALKNRGWFLLNAGRRKEGELDLLAALQRDIRNRQVMSDLAALYSKLNPSQQPDQAREVVARVLTQAPDEPNAWLLQGMLGKDLDAEKGRTGLQRYLQLIESTCCEGDDRRDIGFARSVLERLDAKSAN
jgi:tetratricopeptide (TPR) repeat protein